MTNTNNNINQDSIDNYIFKKIWKERKLITKSRNNIFFILDLL